MFSAISRNNIVQTVKNERIYALSVISSIIDVNRITNI